MNAETETELRRWQDAIRKKLLALAPAANIDAAGSDGADLLDFTLVEIGQGMAYYANIVAVAGQHLKNYHGGGEPEDVVEACAEFQAADEHMNSDPDLLEIVEGLDTLEDCIRVLWNRLKEAQNAPVVTTAFVREAINKHLAALRQTCCVERQNLRWTHNPEWAGDLEPDSDEPDNLEPQSGTPQEQAQRKAERDLVAADEALAAFVVEHRPMMGPAWVGNNHGRLCWAHYSGGMPTMFHRCQREEGHDGDHANEWPTQRLARNSRRGSWPQGVTNEREWREWAGGN